MKYKDHGFRPLYKNFCIYPMNQVLKNALKDEKGIDEADGVMVYGYIDHVAGNTVEFIALTKRMDDEKYSFIKLPDDARFFARVENLAEEEFQFVERGDGHLYEKFKFKIDRLAFYDMNEDMVKSRTLTFLDEFRYPYSYDDVKVILYKEGLELEGVWVKIESLGKGTITGTVMNEPKQDFGVSTGSRIAFIVNESKDKERSLISNLTLGRRYSAEELKGGKILKNAIGVFKKENNQYNFYTVLEMLKESTVLVPQTNVGIEILGSEDKKMYFPVFSSANEMKKCADDVQKKDMQFLEALKLAKSGKDLAGIVVNPDTDGFIIPKGMFNLLEEME